MGEADQVQIGDINVHGRAGFSNGRITFSSKTYDIRKVFDNYNDYTLYNAYKKGIEGIWWYGYQHGHGWLRKPVLQQFSYVTWKLADAIEQKKALEAKKA